MSWLHSLVLSLLWDHPQEDQWLVSRRRLGFWKERKATLLGDHAKTLPRSTHKTSSAFSESSLEPLPELKFENKFTIKNFISLYPGWCCSIQYLINKRQSPELGKKDAMNSEKSIGKITSVGGGNKYKEKVGNSIVFLTSGKGELIFHYFVQGPHQCGWSQFLVRVKKTANSPFLIPFTASFSKFPSHRN